jgi:hypothetical protein
VLKVLLEQVTKVHKALRVLMVPLEILVIKVLKVLLEQVIKVLKELKVFRVT